MLVAENLVKQFGSVNAVNGVSLAVNRGEVIGLLGPNGAGKTTTLRMLAGILTPTSGHIRMDGVELTHSLLDTKQRTGFLSGDTQLYQRMTPREVLFYFGRLYRMDEARLAERVEQMVDELDMGSFADRLCNTLSSGQKQRANIARAFLHEPDLLILDEPTAALDIVSGHFIMDAIQREKARDRAILFSTHIMGEAEHLCDRILFIHNGRIIDEGSVAELESRSGCDNLTDAFLHHIGQG